MWLVSNFTTLSVASFFVGIASWGALVVAAKMLDALVDLHSLAYQWLLGSLFSVGILVVLSRLVAKALGRRVSDQGGFVEYESDFFANRLKQRKERGESASSLALYALIQLILVLVFGSAIAALFVAIGTSSVY